MKNFLNLFIDGLASLGSFTQPPRFEYPFRNDSEALSADWKQVGSYIWQGIEKVDGELTRNRQ
ncbi:MAG TPA: hypothetical protein PKC68_08215 [Alphaproteobacteria bacterium]|nr:hypothetical protein [Alphaproteobacteria bacterium]